MSKSVGVQVWQWLSKLLAGSSQEVFSQVCSGLFRLAVFWAVWWNLTRAQCLSTKLGTPDQASASWDGLWLLRMLAKGWGDSSW